jgi:flagellar protein FlaG
MIANPIGHSTDARPAQSGELASREHALPRAEAAPAPAVEEAQMHEALRQIDAALRHLAVELRYGRDETTRKLVVQVVDGATGEVLRQIPPEEVLAIARGLDRMQGVLLDRKG